MKKYISLFFSVLLIITACQSNTAPSGIIKEREMISLLTDIHIADGLIYSVPQVPDSIYKYGSQKFVVIFKKHHTTDAEFKKSLKYYSTQPEKIQAIYMKIDGIIKAKTDSLNVAETKRREAEQKENEKKLKLKAKEDSLANLKTGADKGIIKTKSDSLSNLKKIKIEADKKAKAIADSLANLKKVKIEADKKIKATADSLLKAEIKRKQKLQRKAEARKRLKNVISVQ